MRAIVADSASVDVAAERRVKSYTLLVGAYAECRRAVTYVRWHEGDVDTIMPTIYKKTRQATGANAEPPASAPAPSPQPAQAQQPEPPEPVPDAPQPVPT